MGEIRKPGRPKKDELVIEKVTVRDYEKIKPKNWEMYAHHDVQNAFKIYKKYQAPWVNPLNIDEKNLDPECKDAWKFVFSQRGIPETQSLNCSERAIYNGNELIFLLEAYCTYIRDHNFVKGFTRPDGEVGVMPIVPNATNFALWIGVPRAAITYVISKEEAWVDREYKGMLADLISEGATMGVYQATMSIFSLKNLCGWADKEEDRTKPEKNEKLSIADARETLAALGYDRKLLGE